MVWVAVWAIGFIASIGFFVASIIEYKKNGKSRTPMIISGIASIVFCVPIVLFIMLIVGLSTGTVGM